MNFKEGGLRFMILVKLLNQVHIWLNMCMKILGISTLASIICEAYLEVCLVMKKSDSDSQFSTSSAPSTQPITRFL